MFLVQKEEALVDFFPPTYHTRGTTELQIHIHP